MTSCRTTLYALCPHRFGMEVRFLQEGAASWWQRGSPHGRGCIYEVVRLATRVPGHAQRVWGPTGRGSVRTRTAMGADVHGHVLVCTVPWRVHNNNNIQRYECGLVVFSMCRLQAESGPCLCPPVGWCSCVEGTRRLQQMARIAARYIANLVLLPAISPSRVGGLAGAGEGQGLKVMNTVGSGPWL
jgi:hypothetical protein